MVVDWQDLIGQKLSKIQSYSKFLSENMLWLALYISNGQKDFRIDV